MVDHSVDDDLDTYGFALFDHTCELGPGASFGLNFVRNSSVDVNVSQR